MVTCTALSRLERRWIDLSCFVDDHSAGLGIALQRTCQIERSWSLYPFYFPVASFFFARLVVRVYIASSPYRQRQLIGLVMQDQVTGSNCKEATD